MSTDSENSVKPVVAENIVIGELCAFLLDSKQFPASNTFKIGKILQFVEFSSRDKGKKTKPYKGHFANVKGNIGVLCTWYLFNTNTNEYTKADSVNITYHPVKAYICSLTRN